MSARELSTAHREMLEASAIAPEVITARGYWTVTRKVELEELGFAGYQRAVPALVVPVHNIYGEVVNYQARPDTPRIDAERGRPVKYETIAGGRMVLDVPPASRAALANPDRELWITEGIKKGDALASADAGVCAIALLGVWCWRGTNDKGGKTVLPDWDSIALNERRVFIVFDSDVMEKPGVHAALERLVRFLESRGAVVNVVYLPAGENGKQGVDDFLATGASVAELRALAEGGLRPLPRRGPERRPPEPTRELLRYLENLISRHVKLASKHELVAVILFVMHTWALASARVTPYLLVLSPAKRSGKTRLLEVLELAVREPIRATSVTPAAIYQAIAALRPTLLVDEVDAIFASARPSERTEELRGVLNAGNARGSEVLRGTQEGVPARFSIYCPKVMAGIDNGKLPDTIRDRSIVIEMQRKRGDEAVARLRMSELADQIEDLRRRLEDWAAAHLDELAGYRAEPIPQISDRLDEAWEPLQAIAALAGERWLAAAREAAVALAGRSEEEGQDDRLVLLRELRKLFGDEKHALLTETICKDLNADEELPFGGKRGGQGFDARGLAALLRPYKIKSRSAREGDKTGKGYHRDQFSEVWARYLGDARAADPAVEGSQGSQGSHPKAHGAGDVTHVTDVTHETLGSACAYSPNGNGAAPRTVADLSDPELLELFPRSELESIDELISPCGCETRMAKWRPRGPALEVTCTYLSRKAYHEAAEREPTNDRGVIPKGPASGWAWQTKPLPHGRPWVCGLCHPPAEGLDIEWKVVGR